MRLLPHGINGIVPSMNTLSILTKNSYRRSTWKNGLGFTDEIAIHPPGSDLRRGDYLWRLSSARIEQASAFSIFPNHDRILSVLEGAGIRLYHRFDEETPEELTELNSGVSYEFPGDIQSRCELMAGPVQDLSVFFRKGEVESAMEVIELPENEVHEISIQSRWTFVFVAGAPVTALPFDDAQEHPEQSVQPGETLFLSLSDEGNQPPSNLKIRAHSSGARISIITLNA